LGLVNSGTSSIEPIVLTKSHVRHVMHHTILMTWTRHSLMYSWPFPCHPHIGPPYNASLTHLPKPMPGLPLTHPPSPPSQLAPLPGPGLQWQGIPHPTCFHLARPARSRLPHNPPAVPTLCLPSLEGLSAFLAVGASPSLRCLHLRLRMVGAISISRGHLSRSSRSPPSKLPSLSMSSKVSPSTDDSHSKRKLLRSTLSPLTCTDSECSRDVMCSWEAWPSPCSWRGGGSGGGAIGKDSCMLVREFGTCSLGASLAFL
jgi:hypothetical protein